MKTRILCFLMLLIATSSLCTVNAQSYYWEENTTPFTMHYILDISSNYNGIPPEIKCLGGSFGIIGTAKFYKDKVILNDKIVFDLPDHKSNGNKRFISKYTYNLNSKEQVNYMLSFRPSNGKTSLREPDPCLMVIYFEKGGNNFSREEPEYIRIRLLTETAFRALENKARSDNATNVPVNTYSGGYENNNTNNNTINNALERGYINTYNTLLKNLEYWINDYNNFKNSSYYDPTSSMHTIRLNQARSNIKDTKEEIRKLRKEAAKDGINIPMSSLENISVN